MTRQLVVMTGQLVVKNGHSVALSQPLSPSSPLRRHPTFAPQTHRMQTGHTGMYPRLPPAPPPHQTLFGLTRSTLVAESTLQCFHNHALDWHHSPFRGFQLLGWGVNAPNHGGGAVEPPKTAVRVGGSMDCGPIAGSQEEGARNVSGLGLELTGPWPLNTPSLPPSLSNHMFLCSKHKCNAT